MSKSKRLWTRGDCETYIKPLQELGVGCPMTQCRWHLLRDSHRTELPADGCCALDVADRGGETLQEVGELLGVSRERVRQLEAVALRRWRREAKRNPELREWLLELGHQSHRSRTARAIADYPEAWR